MVSIQDKAGAIIIGGNISAWPTSVAKIHCKWNMSGRVLQNVLSILFLAGFYIHCVLLFALSLQGMQKIKKIKIQRVSIKKNNAEKVKICLWIFSNLNALRISNWLNWLNWCRKLKIYSFFHMKTFVKKKWIFLCQEDESEKTEISFNYF